MIKHALNKALQALKFSGKQVINSTEWAAKLANRRFWGLVESAETRAAQRVLSREMRPFAERILARATHPAFTTNVFFRLWAVRKWRLLVWFFNPMGIIGRIGVLFVVMFTIIYLLRFRNKDSETILAYFARQKAKGTSLEAAISGNVFNLFSMFVQYGIVFYSIFFIGFAGFGYYVSHGLDWTFLFNTKELNLLIHTGMDWVYTYCRVHAELAYKETYEFIVQDLFGYHHQGLSNSFVAAWQENFNLVAKRTNGIVNYFYGYNQNVTPEVAKPGKDVLHSVLEPSLFSKKTNGIPFQPILAGQNPVALVDMALNPNIPEAQWVGYTAAYHHYTQPGALAFTLNQMVETLKPYVVTALMLGVVFGARSFYNWYFEVDTLEDISETANKPKITQEKSLLDKDSIAQENKKEGNWDNMTFDEKIKSTEDFMNKRKIITDSDEEEEGGILDSDSKQLTKANTPPQENDPIKDIVKHTPKGTPVVINQTINYYNLNAENSTVNTNANTDTSNTTANSNNTQETNSNNSLKQLNEKKINVDNRQEIETNTTSGVNNSTKTNTTTSTQGLSGTQAALVTGAAGLAVGGGGFVRAVTNNWANISTGYKIAGTLFKGATGFGFPGTGAAAETATKVIASSLPDANSTVVNGAKSLMSHFIKKA
jgi:hypothetical protein